MKAQGMNNEKYKEHILEMLDKINDERSLKQIYRVVHAKFINRDIENEVK